MIKSLKISEIRTDAGTQIRVRLDEVTVAEYAEAYRSGVKFPPVIVFKTPDDYILADGFHRRAGAERAGFKDILTFIKDGTAEDALKYSLSANAHHGLKRTNADKRNAVVIALKKWPKKSDRELAEICAVDHHTVASVRGTAQSTGEVPQLSTRIGKDGKERRLPPPPIVNPQKVPVKEPAKASESKPVPVVVLDAEKQKIPVDLLPLWERRHEAQELLKSISQVRTALKAAQENMDPMYSEVNFSSALANLDQAYADVKRAVPHAVCPTCKGRSVDSCRMCKPRGFISKHLWDTVVPAETKEMVRKLAAKNS
jgi:hypothetical protein